MRLIVIDKIGKLKRPAKLTVQALNENGEKIILTPNINHIKIKSRCCEKLF